MSLSAWLPPLIVGAALGPGLIIAFLAEHRHRLRTALNLLAAGSQIVLVGILIKEVAGGTAEPFRVPFVADFAIRLHTDGLSLLLASLSAVLWFLTTLFAIAYFEGAPHRSRFFGFFSLCVSATMGVALAGNLLTFLIFYELLTVATYPLVVHRGTSEALNAGRIYMGYTLVGGLVLMLGIVWLETLVGPVPFTPGGVLKPTTAPPAVLSAIFGLLIIGLGVKAALFPLHGWLPIAMVAPAPVSALLHAVAVVKAGAFGIVRVVHNVFGSELAMGLGLAPVLAIAATFTILYGSLHALSQDYLKRRLAYSTVSQISYILLGIALGGTAAIGGLVHLVYQGIMKITLFFCAGTFAETLGVHRVSEMAGLGQRMPWAMAAFTVGALGMIGVPPTAGFITKWYLGLGALDAGATWVVAVLVVSSLLNAAYFLPIIYTGWFQSPDNPWPSLSPGHHLEASWMLLMPPLATASFALLLGLLAQFPLGVVDWAHRIIQPE